MQARESTATLKPRADVSKSPDQGYQWPYKKNLRLPKIFKKRKTISFLKSITTGIFKCTLWFNFNYLIGSNSCFLSSFAFDHQNPEKLSMSISGCVSRNDFIRNDVFYTRGLWKNLIDEEFFTQLTKWSVHIVKVCMTIALQNASVVFIFYCSSKTSFHWTLLNRCTFSILFL